MSGFYKGKVILDKTVTEQKLSLDLQEKINNRVPKDITTSVVRDDNVRPELGTPDRPYVKEILDTVSGKLVVLKDRIETCLDTKNRDVPVLTAARRLLGWDVTFKEGDVFSLPGATKENIDGPISVLIAGELSHYIDFAYNMDNYEGGPFTAVWIQDIPQTGVITGEIIYVIGGLTATTEITFTNSDPLLEVTAEEYYKITKEGDYWDIEVVGAHLSEPIDYNVVVKETAIPGAVPPVQVVPLAGWDPYTGGTLRIQFIGDEFRGRMVMNVEITSSNVLRAVEVGSAGQETALIVLTGGNAELLSYSESEIGSHNYVFGFAFAPTTGEFTLDTIQNPSELASVVYSALPSTAPWSGLLITPPPALVYSITYTPLTEDLNSYNMTITVDTVENDRYGTSISILYVGSHENAGIRIDPEESINNEFGLGDVVTFQVTTNSTGTPSYALSAEISPYFTVEEGAGWSEFGNTSFTATLLLRVTTAVPTSGVDGTLTVTMQDITTLTATARVQGVGIGDDVPRLVVESAPYYHMINVGDTWQIPVTGYNLTNEIELTVPSSLTPYMALTKNSGWNNLTGGTMTLTCTNLPTNRLVDTITIHSGDESESFEIGFSGVYPLTSNPNFTITNESPYNFGNVEPGDTLSGQVTATIVEGTASAGGYITWQANNSADPTVNAISLLKVTSSDQTSIEMMAAFSPTAEGDYQRDTTVRVYITDDDRYPFTYTFTFLGKSEILKYLIIEPEEYTNLQWDGTPITFVVVGYGLTT